MTSDLKTTVTTMALILAPLAAQAHHRGDHDGGTARASEARQGGGLRSGNGLRGGDVAAEANGGRPCAWGLADREMPCVPPGQAARQVMTNDWIGAPDTNLVDGTVISAEDFAVLDNTERLPVLEEGLFYALAGDAVIVVEAADATTPTTYTVVSTYGRAAFPGNWNR